MNPNLKTVRMARPYQSDKPTPTLNNYPHDLFYLCVCQDLRRYYLIRPKSLPRINERCEYFASLLALVCGKLAKFLPPCMWRAAAYFP